MANPFREALQAGRFCHVVELVASGLRREAQVLEVASRLAAVPEVVAGSVTSYAGGQIGHDPIRVGTAARARGLTPNIHLTCVGQDRHGLRKTLEDLHALGIENVFALTGDYPRGPHHPPPVFDLDSVQLVHLIQELRQAGLRFHVSVAVSPFKYLEADCRWQYLKLEKKVAAGADCVITQVGWDAEKFRELRRYLDERGLRVPVLGNVYVLGPRAAERMARGEPPGCWVAPALLEAVRRESQARDGGRRARLERAARLVAVLRGLGYAGAYLGGTHDAAQVAWIIRRGQELAPRWEELAEEFRYGMPGGFYLYGAPARPGGRPAPAGSGGHDAATPMPGTAPPGAAPRPGSGPPASGGPAGGAVPGPAPQPPAGAAGPPAGLGVGPALGPPPPAAPHLLPLAVPAGGWRGRLPPLLDALGRLFPVTREGPLRRLLRRAAAWVDRRPALARALERVELAVKRPMFGCQACGNCVLGHLEYVCPQTCPKQLRNGPCGGTFLGRCEVVDQPCVWTAVYQRARAAGRLAALAAYVPPPDRALQGTSSWLNYFLDRDRRPPAASAGAGVPEPRRGGPHG